jgi:GNAT superfamily N-acetyltransferase
VGYLEPVALFRNTGRPPAVIPSGHLIEADTRGSPHAQTLVAGLFTSFTTPLRAASNVHTKSLTAFTMKDVREPLAAPDQTPKISLIETVPTDATRTAARKSSVIATKTQSSGLTGSPQEAFDGHSIESRRAIFEKAGCKENADQRFDGASRTADPPTARVVNSDEVDVDGSEPTPPSSASDPGFETSDDDRLESTLDLHLLTPNDWRILRTARLRALFDSPHAFTSSYACESGLGEPEWRRMFDSATWIVAREAEDVIGLARTVGEAERPAPRHIESIWVAPTHRRRGVCRALLCALVEIECSMGVTDLLLWVLEDNRDAQRVYDALGFEPTGERQPMAPAGRYERRLKLSIGRLQSDEPAARRLAVDRRSTKVDQSPRLELEEVHSLPCAADIVYTGGEPLPFVEVLLPGSEESHAQVSSDGVVELPLGGC